jgi:rhodanese-related sulfurtransferase
VTIAAIVAVAAAVLAVEALALSGYFARHSLALTASNPLVWNLKGGILAWSDQVDASIPKY